VDKNLFTGKVKEIAYFGSYNTYILNASDGTAGQDHRVQHIAPRAQRNHLGRRRVFLVGSRRRRRAARLRQARAMAKFSLPMPGRRFVIGVPYVWLVLFFLLPFLILLYISFVDMGNDIHPFKPIWDTETGVLKLKYENYWSIFRRDDGAALFDTIYIEAYLRSIWYALCTALLCLFIGYPFSYFIARSKPSVRPALLMMVMLPFWTSFLLRVYAWKGILADQGIVNQT
jgi:ABC-type Fe3+ transport system permease subunit